MDTYLLIPYVLAGILVFAGIQFLFIGMSFKNHPEYGIFGILVLFQAYCIWMGIDLTLTIVPEDFISGRVDNYNATAVINILFLFFIATISKYSHWRLGIAYLLSVLIVLVFNNLESTYVVLPQDQWIGSEVSNLLRQNSKISVSPWFELFNTLQFVILMGYSVKAYYYQRSLQLDKSVLQLVCSSLFVAGSFSDVLYDLGIFALPVSIYFFAAMVFYTSIMLSWNIGKTLQIKQQIQQGEANLHQIIDLVPDLVFARDAQGRFIFANKALTDIYNTTATDIIGKTDDIFNKNNEEVAFFRKIDQQVLNSGQAMVIQEEPITDQNNNTRYLRTTKIPFIHKGNKAILGVGTDITDIRQFDKMLMSKDKLLETIFESASVAIFLLDQSHQVIKVNKSGIELLKANKKPSGLNRLGNYFYCSNLVTQSDVCGKTLKCANCNFFKSIRTTFGEQNNLKNQYAHLKLQNNGTETYFDVMYSTTYLEINGDKLALLLMEDISNLKQIERDLQESELKYRQITHAISDYLYTVVVHENGLIETIHTPAAEPVTGYKAEEFDSDPNLWLNIVYEEDRQQVKQFIEMAAYNSSMSVMEHRIVRKDKSIIWVSNTLIFKKSLGKAMGYEGVIHDITKRKNAEIALEYRNTLFQTMMDNLPIGIYMIDAKTGKPMLANNHAVKLLGKSILPDISRENLAETYQAFLVGTNNLYPEQKMPIIRALSGEFSSIDDMEIEHPDGSRKLLEIVGSPVIDNDTILLQVW